MKVVGGADAIPIVTSLAPRALTDERHAIFRRALDSFAQNGFTPVSVNWPDEIDAIAARFPDTHCVTASPERIFVGRYGPSLGAAFSAAGDSEICAVINADIYMVPSNIRNLVTARPDAFFVAHRLDVGKIGGDALGLYRDGIDAVFFHRTAFAPVLEDTDLCRFQFGAPFWDLVIPMAASFHGPVVFLEPPFILHAMHEARWSHEDYDVLQQLAFQALIAHARKHASKPIPRMFLAGFDRHIGLSRDLGDPRTAKRAKLLLDQWMKRVEACNTTTVRAHAQGTLSEEALQLLASGHSLPDTPRLKEFSEPPPSPWRRLQRHLKARRRQRREAALAGAFASVPF